MQFKHFHWQNLNRGRDDKIKGSGFWHGRAWWTFGEKEGATKLTVNPEWVFGKSARNLAIGFHVGDRGDHEIQFHISIPFLLSLYLTLESRVFGNSGNELGIRFDNYMIHWSLWRDPWGTIKSNDWRYDGISWERLFKGRSKVTHRELAKQPVVIPMPEGPYEGEGTLEEVTETYRRWPWPRVWTVANIDLPKGIPIPGKGENSWDLDEDAVFGMGGAADSIGELIPRLIASVERDRERYGGKNWTPEQEHYSR